MNNGWNKNFIFGKTHPGVVVQRDAAAVRRDGFLTVERRAAKQLKPLIKLQKPKD